MVVRGEERRGSFLRFWRRRRAARTAPRTAPPSPPPRSAARISSSGRTKRPRSWRISTMASPRARQSPRGTILPMPVAARGPGRRGCRSSPPGCRRAWPPPAPGRSTRCRSAGPGRRRRRRSPPSPGGGDDAEEDELVAVAVHQRLVAGPVGLVGDLVLAGEDDPGAGEGAVHHLQGADQQVRALLLDETAGEADDRPALRRPGPAQLAHPLRVRPRRRRRKAGSPPPFRDTGSGSTNGGRSPPCGRRGPARRSPGSGRSRTSAAVMSRLTAPAGSTRSP